MSFLNKKFGKLEIVRWLVDTEFELAIAVSLVKILSSSDLEIFLSIVIRVTKQSINLHSLDVGNEIKNILKVRQRYFYFRWYILIGWHIRPTNHLTYI